MRIFGCLVYAKENKAGQDKFDERGRLGIFVGQPQAQKGYQIFDLKENKINFSRDVTIIEAKSPYDKEEESSPVDDNLNNDALDDLGRVMDSPIC